MSYLNSTTWTFRIAGAASKAVAGLRAPQAGSAGSLPICGDCDGGILIQD